MNYQIVSADDHIDLQWLPKDLWQKRVPEKYREQAPKVVDTPDGPYWVGSFTGIPRYQARPPRPQRPDAFHADGLRSDIS